MSEVHIQIARGSHVAIFGSTAMMADLIRCVPNLKVHPLLSSIKMVGGQNHDGPMHFKVEHGTVVIMHVEKTQCIYWNVHVLGQVSLWNFQSARS